MNIGLLIPGFSADEQDWCIPVYLNLVRRLAITDNVRVYALRYPPRRLPYKIYGVTVQPLNGGSHTSGFGRLRLWLRTLITLRTAHQQTPFDVLHAIWADETGLIAQWAGQILHIPSVVSIAGGELVGIPDINYGLQLSRFSHWTVNQALQADKVIVPCEYMSILARPFVNTNRLHIVPLGIDIDLFTPNNSHEQRPKQVGACCIAVGSINKVKDHAMSLRVLKKLRTPFISLGIYGDDSNRLVYDTLQQQAERLDIQNQVWLGKAIIHNDLPSLYQNADLHLLTSRHEAFGMVVAEAAACGLPTVGLARGILPDLAAAGGGIAIIPDMQAEANFAAAIDMLLADPARLKVMREAALKFAHKHLTLDVMSAGIRNVYKQVVSSNG